MKEITDICEAIEQSRMLREKLLSDKDRPGYHFVCPEDVGLPGDPNAAFYANGRYHLMYLYASRTDKWRYGHMSSIDLIHWRSHPDPILPDELDGGIFSGGAFVDDDGTVYVSYWALDGKDVGGADGIRIAYSSDAGNHYTEWKKFKNKAVDADESGILNIKEPDGTVRHLAAADPSNIWKKDGVYYMEGGCLQVLKKYGEGHDREDKYRGDFVDLYRSRDLISWEPVHRFYERDKSDKWTDRTEDAMCPSFLPLPLSKNGGKLSDKYLQLFISHNKGCQYYIGTYRKDSDKFIPEKHGRMTWVDNTFFAPEAVMGPDNRQIMWAWLLDNRSDELMKYGWSGVFGLPRTLWLNEKGELGIAPVDELKMLRYNEMNKVDRMKSASCEIRITVDMKDAARFGLRVKAAADNSEYTLIYYDAVGKKLVFDSTKSGTEGRMTVEKAPFELAAGEKLELDVFIDNSVIDVFANDRQAITRRVYTAGADSNNIGFYSEGNAEIIRQTAWEMMPSNMF